MKQPYILTAVFTICGAFLPLTSSALPLQLLAEGVPELPILRRAYPDVEFEGSFDSAANDWKISVICGGRVSILYRAEGRYVTHEQLASQKRFRQLIYNVSEKLTDPADFTQEQIERITRFGSSENRRTAPVSSTGFFEAVYDCSTRETTEKHIITVSFLDKRVRIHERISASLDRVETKIRILARTDTAAGDFIHTLGTADGYFWRQIRDTSGRSFHSMGLAVDILPLGWQKKVIYWNWEKNKGNERWMLIPLAERWMPPEKVVAIFESEGFIWGGKWPVWDNMHFEYRPELLAGKPLQ